MIIIVINHFIFRCHELEMLIIFNRYPGGFIYILLLLFFITIRKMKSSVWYFDRSNYKKGISLGNNCTLFWLSMVNHFITFALINCIWYMERCSQKGIWNFWISNKGVSIFYGNSCIFGKTSKQFVWLITEKIYRSTCLVYSFQDLAFDRFFFQKNYLWD